MRGRAREEFDMLNDMINNLGLDPLVPDDWIMCWGDFHFKIRKFYAYCFREIFAPPYLTVVWKTKCMMRHKVFAWLMLVGKLNTGYMLCRRHFQIGEDRSCLICPTDALETSHHLFFSCKFSVSYWSVVHISWNTTLQLRAMFDEAARGLATCTIKGNHNIGSLEYLENQKEVLL